MKTTSFFLNLFILVALMTACHNSSSTTSTSEAGATDSTISCSGIAIPYLSPNGLPIIEGNSNTTYIYKRPNKNSPRLMVLDEGEGGWTLFWEDDKQANEYREWGAELFSFVHALLIDSADGFKKILYDDFIGYIPENSAKQVEIIPITKASFCYINKGDYRGLVYDFSAGEGGSWYGNLGIIENGKVIFAYGDWVYSGCMKDSQIANAIFDKLFPDRYYTDPDNCALESFDKTAFKDLTAEEQNALVEYFIDHPRDYVTISYKCESNMPDWEVFPSCGLSVDDDLLAKYGSRKVWSPAK